MDNLPQWLAADDNYKPIKDKDAFIDKSILSIFKMLSKLKSGTSYHSYESSLNPELKLGSVLVFVVLAALSFSITFMTIMDAAILILLSFLEGNKIIHILKVVIAAVVFSAVILTPSMAVGNVTNGMLILFKIFGTVAAVNILSATTQWNSISSALKRLFVPDLFIFVLDITLRYINTLGELALEMLQGMKKRLLGKSKEKNAQISAVIGTLFIKSKEMAEEMQEAMECRGFTGEYSRRGNKKKLRFGDYILICINVIMLLLYLEFGR